jgi:SAM-dependent methyltransferase
MGCASIHCHHLQCSFAVVMQRTVEPELMDDPLQVSAYAGADFSATDQALVDRLGEVFGGAVGTRLVDLGCGPGNISFRLADRFPQAAVVGLDGAPAMVEVAQRGLAQRALACPGLADRVSFRLVHLGSKPLAYGGFSAVVSNSLLHHLHNPQALWSHLRQLAAPGAAVYIKDLRRPATPEAARALLQKHVVAAPAVLQRDYLASLHAAFEPAEVEAQLRLAGLPVGEQGLRVAALEDRYLEVWGRL